MTERITGIIDRLADATDYNAISWILDAPVQNLAEAVVDDTMKRNADFQHKAGLTAKVVRYVADAKPCDWCVALEGEYTYPDVPPDVWRRHDNCHCIIEYTPAGGGRVDILTGDTKSWELQNPDDIAERVQYTGDATKPLNPEKAIEEAENYHPEFESEVFYHGGETLNEIDGRFLFTTDSKEAAMDYALMEEDPKVFQIKIDPHAKVAEVDANGAWWYEFGQDDPLREMAYDYKNEGGYDVLKISNIIDPAGKLDKYENNLPFGTPQTEYIILNKDVASIVGEPISVEKKIQKDIGGFLSGNDIYIKRDGERINVDWKAYRGLSVDDYMNYEGDDPLIKLVVAKYKDVNGIITAEEYDKIRTELFGFGKNGIYGI